MGFRFGSVSCTFSCLSIEKNSKTKSHDSIENNSRNERYDLKKITEQNQNKKLKICKYFPNCKFNERCWYKHVSMTPKKHGERINKCFKHITINHQPTNLVSFHTTIFNSPFSQVSNNINPTSPITGQYPNQTDNNQLISITLKDTHIPQHKNNLNHKTKSSLLKNEDYYNKKNKFKTNSNSITSTTKTENKKLRNKTRRSKRKKKGKTDIKIMYSNIRGYRSKRNSLIQILEEVKPDIVLLIETNLKGNTAINVPGYRAVCRNRKNFDGGGLAILVNNSIKQNIFIHKIEDNNVECIWIRLGQDTAQPIYIALYYGKQENENKEVINDEIFNLSTEIKREKINTDKILVIGDLNAKMPTQLTGEDSRNGKIIRNLINENNLIITNYTDKCVGKWTRVNTNNEHERSVIDYIAYLQKRCSKT